MRAKRVSSSSSITRWQQTAIKSWVIRPKGGGTPTKTIVLQYARLTTKGTTKTI